MANIARAALHEASADVETITFTMSEDSDGSTESKHIMNADQYWGYAKLQENADEILNANNGDISSGLIGLSEAYHNLVTAPSASTSTCGRQLLNVIGGAYEAGWMNYLDRSALGFVCNDALYIARMESISGFWHRDRFQFADDEGSVSDSEADHDTSLES